MKEVAKLFLAFCMIVFCIAIVCAVPFCVVRCTSVAWNGAKGD